MTDTLATPAKKHAFLPLMLGSIGVVYGDIGTSPLYAFRESLAAAAGHGGIIMPSMVLGILSLILWSILIIVTLKYVVLILRADHHGEGGILSLMVLAQEAVGKKSNLLLYLGMAGCALFFGDAIITPAISVLSALEGLSLVTPDYNGYIIPMALTIMVGLFTMQRFGTERVSRFFGPIMMLWFVVMGVGGAMHILDQPDVWRAINPLYGLAFLRDHGLASFIALGAVVLSITGAEALYADMGHFGKKPIRGAWFIVVLPSLLLNYFGQAALVLSNPLAAENSFFLLYPQWALLPMVILAGFATVIASQAVITGAYSLAHQAVQLGILPRLHVKYTSHDHKGQIYMPQINTLLFIGVVVLIEMFRSSSSLASAYGIAVTGTMVITAIMAYMVARYYWRWPLVLAVAVMMPLFLIDSTFLAANMLKFFAGGFIPVLLASFLIMLMCTWVRGSRTLQEQTFHQNTTLASLFKSLRNRPVQRVEGGAFYLTSSMDYAPSALLQNLKHNKVLHENNVLLTLRFESCPHVPVDERIEEHIINKDFTRLIMKFGYMDAPNVMYGLKLWRKQGGKCDIDTTSFFISRRNIVPSKSFGMPVWRDRLYITMANHASDAASYFCLPPSRVVELGVQMTV